MFRLYKLATFTGNTKNPQISIFRYFKKKLLLQITHILFSKKNHIKLIKK